MKFSIITPARNMEPWIGKTIENVLSQEGDFEIEYIVMEDGSTDGTVRVAQEYADKLQSGVWSVRCKGITMQVLSQDNTGMYEAINRGFARATGDIYAWINADDIYQPGAFAAMAKTFGAFPEIEWLKGITDIIDTRDATIADGHCYIYKQSWIKRGVYGQEAYFIQQDSVFWKKSLWEKAGPMPAHYRSAADYWLWIQMARHAPLWSLNVRVSCFRKREGQISGNVSKYKKEQWEVRPRRSMSAWMARLFFTPQSRLMPHAQGFFRSLYPILFSGSNPQYYIEMVGGVPTKKIARSYIA